MKIVRGILATVLSMGIIFGTAFAERSIDLSQAAQRSVTQENALVELPASERRINLPGAMRAVFIAPERDFSLDTDKLGELFAGITDLGMNTVIIETTGNDKSYYDISLEASDDDILLKAMDAAHKANLSVYVTLDVNSLLKTVAEQGGGLKSGFSAAAHKFVMKYACEGILLTDYYTADSAEAHAEYLNSGSGIGYENWLYESNRYIMRTLGEVVRKTTNSTAVGLLIEDMWANASSLAGGSDTVDTTQAYFDGHCDTKKYVESKYFDFVMVKAYGSTYSENLKFENVVSWWNRLSSSSGVKTYVCHLNERIGEYSGWNEDQLLQQLTVMKDLGGSISGSAFNSLSSLNSNPLQSTDSLMKFFADDINLDTTFDQLKMTSPSEFSFATYDASVKFSGTFDENFDVLFDGEKIETDGTNSFNIVKNIGVGMNYFTIEHKGTKYSYSIERKIDNVLSSVHSLGYITADEGTTLSFTATAYSGANVYVSIGGEKIALAERGSTEHIENGGTYSEFVGYYTVEGGEIGSARYLGDLTYYAEYGGYSESKWGGNVTIAAKPEPPAEPDPIIAEVVPDKTQLIGIDVSIYQGDIDFEEVKNAGYDFVIIKAGQWNYPADGFETYYLNAKDAGLHIGFYWFCDGETIEEISLEADACIETLAGLQFDLPVFMDFENQYQFDEGMEFCSEAVRTFCGKLEAAGYNTGIYVSTSWLDYVLDDDIKSQYTIWVADWRGFCGYYGKYGMWQYGAGEVPGIGVLTDLNIMELSNLRPM